MAPGIALGLLIALAVGLIAPVAAFAAEPPANDMFANAQPLEMLPQTFSDVDIAWASWEPAERWPCSSAGSTAKTVWYTFTYDNVRDGFVQVDAPGAKVTAFYLPSGSTIADLSAGYCKGTSSLLIPWSANRTEYVQVAWDGSTSPIDVTFSWVPVPLNDNLAYAEPVVLDPDTLAATTTGDTRLATIERAAGTTTPASYDIPWCGWSSVTFARSVWYWITVARSGMLSVDPTESSFPDVTLTVFQVFPNGNMNRMGCASARTPLAFTVSPDAVYAIQAVEAVPGRSGTLSGGGLLRLAWALDLAPQLTVPRTMTVEATSPAGATVTFETSAADAEDGSITPTCNRPSGSAFPIGSTWVSCSASDAAGNIAYGAFLVIVRDTVAPMVLVPADLAVEATGPDGAVVSYDVAAMDVASSSITPTCDRPSGSTFPIGTTTVACTAVDAAGNVAQERRFSITVRDSLAPTVTYGTHPGTYTVADRVQITCGASDAVGVTTSTCAGIDAYGWELGLGVHTYTATASDASGNGGTATTELTVVATYRSMSELTKQWVTKAGVAKDLLAILASAAAAESKGQLQAEANKLAEYRAMVTAQAGKSISAARAALLVTFSYDL